MRAVACADEAEQQLSRLAPSGCQLSADFHVSGAGLRKKYAGTQLISMLRLKFEVAGQANSPSVCASVQTVSWAHEDEKQLSKLAPSGCQLSADVRIFGAGLRKEPHRHHPHSQASFAFEVTRHASIPSLCASVRAVAWADENEQQLSRLAPSDCQLSEDVRIFAAELRQELGRHFHHSKVTFHISGGKTSISPSLCASVRAVAWADEAEQQLSRLAPSDCQLSADVRIFAAELRQAHARMPEDMFKVSGGTISKQPQSLCLCASSSMGT